MSTIAIAEEKTVSLRSSHMDRGLLRSTRQVPVGKMNFSYTGAEPSTIGKLHTLCFRLDTDYASFFDKPMNVRMTVDHSTDSIAPIFKIATPETFRGHENLGWDIRKFDGRHIFYNPRRSVYFALSEGTNHLNIDYYLPKSEDTHSRLNLGSLDALMRGSTNSVVIHGSVIEHEGKGILITAPTRSGKTTMVAQLISAGMKFNLVSEDRVLVNPEGAHTLFCHEFFVRKDTLPYLGLNGGQDMRVDFRKYVGITSSVKQIDHIIMPKLNTEGSYGTRKVPVDHRSIVSEVMFQAVAEAQSNAAKMSKDAATVNLPTVGHEFIFSSDAKRTAEQLKGVLRN